MSFSEIWDRVATETDIGKYSQLADLVGTTGQYISRKKAKGEFPVEWAFKVSVKYGILTEWLMFGTGPKRLSDNTNLVENEKYTEFSLIPKYKAKLSGGHGSFETSDQIEANLSFRTEFIRRKGNPKDMALFEIIGDSMKPFIYEGDVVLVDMSKNTLEDIVDGKAYAFREDHTVKVKRLSRQGNRLIATSENVMKYPPYEIIIEEFFLIGKVVWLGHEVT